MNRYEINVSWQGRHFFATHERSCQSARDAMRVAREIERRFPRSEGYVVNVTHWTESGTTMAVNDLEDKL